MMFFIITLVVVILDQINKIFTQNVPISPCPKVFQYIYDGSEWIGLLTVRNPDMAQVLHVKVTLSVRGKPTTSYLGEISLITRGQFLPNTPILYKINFPKSHFLPKVLQIAANNNILCLGGVDHSVFVTQIQLEHTRKLTLVPPLQPPSVESLQVPPQQMSIPAGSLKNVDSKLLPILFEKNPMKQISNCGLISGTGTRIPADDVEIHTSIDEDSPHGGAPSASLLSMSKLSRGEWPWLAAIYVNNFISLTYQCAGTLISSRIVVSSAHCFSTEEKRYTANEVVVFLGRNNLKNWNEEGSLAVSCDDIFIHPGFDKQMKTYDADIAIIVLKSKVIFNTFIRPACIWSSSTDLKFIEGERGVVIGWSTKMDPHNSPSNTTSDDTTIPEVILSSIVSNQVCFEINEKYRSLSSNRTFCAKTYNDRRACRGISGAGLLTLKNNRWTIRGITSATIPIPNNKSSCGVSEFVIYSDIAKFLDWIYVFVT